MGGSVRHFTEDEDAFIRRRYGVPGWTATKIAEELRRSPSSVHDRAKRLSLTKFCPAKGEAQRRRRDKRREEAEELSPLPIPVSTPLSRLAAFDPLFQRVVTEKRLGLPPGHLIHRWAAHG